MVDVPPLTPLELAGTVAEAVAVAQPPVHQVLETMPFDEQLPSQLDYPYSMQDPMWYEAGD